MDYYKNETSFPLLKESMEKRFWAKVNRRGEDECWEWLGWKIWDGYGMFDLKGKKIRAHRMAWELTHGEIPEDMVVRHKCRGKCVNPRHLELGTIADNHQDQVRDDTLLRGEQNPSSKLTSEQVQEIRSRLQAYHHGLARQLAHEFNVSEQVISKIRHGRTWTHLL